jgi:hypothetical protein
MSGRIGFQNLIFGKREGHDRYWFQANGYVGNGTTPGRLYVCDSKPTTISFHCLRKPSITAEDGVGGKLTITREWDPEAGIVTVTCDHAGGAVNFRIGIP